MRVMIGMTIISIMIRVVVRKKKNGIMWEKFPNWGEEGLTQTHFLMSIYEVIFGMPKWLPTNLACHLS